jgi:2-keto-4-pentenoate hydratase/2-oxohepta-3-ene-1,7-dioic acid hydratase in catechol pathway
MKFVRFFNGKDLVYGIVEGTSVQQIEGSPFTEYVRTRHEFDLSKLKLLPPCSPSKIVCLALNYRAHASEVEKDLPQAPEIFIKPSTSVIGHEDNIIIDPDVTQKVGFEAELAVVIKKTAKNVPEEKAMDYVLGYTCFNDVSARDIQRKEKHRTRAKSLDTFGPTGPFLVTDIDPGNLAVKSYLNGTLAQSATTKQLIFGIKTLISFISQGITLLPGDMIATGTPENTGFLVPGDTIEVEIEQVGRLKNCVTSP